MWFKNNPVDFVNSFEWEIEIDLEDDTQQKKKLWYKNTHLFLEMINKKDRE